MFIPTLCGTPWNSIDIVQGHGTNPHGCIMLWTTWWSNLYIFDKINAVQEGPPQALLIPILVGASCNSIDIVQGHGTDPHGWIMLWATWLNNLCIFDKINAANVVAMHEGPPQALTNVYSHFVWGPMEFNWHSTRSWNQPTWLNNVVNHMIE
jgi:hypothetical protein